MKEKKNYIDNIPKINDMKWDVSEDGISRNLTSRKYWIL